MSHPCKVKVRKVVIESVEVCPFAVDCSLRELARRTGFDVGYLSRIKNGKITISRATLHKLYAGGEL